MSDTVKIIIEIPKEDYKKLVNPYQHNEIWCERLKRMVIHGIPLDDVKAEIREQQKEYQEWGWAYDDVLDILDNIGKESGGNAE